MGTTVLVLRLALRDIRRHLAQASLLIISIATAAATLTMGLAMNGVTSEHPYATTRAATKGPDVVAYLTSASQATPLLQAPAVVSHSGPFPIASGVIRYDGRVADVYAEGRSESPSEVDQPLLTDGSWVRPDAVVIERTFADALGVSVGDDVAIGGRQFHVAGIAATASQSPYPNLCNGTFETKNPATSYFSNSCPSSFRIPFLSLPGRDISSSDDVGLIWMTEQDAIGITSQSDPLTTYALNLKLRDPSDAAVFAYDHQSTSISLTDWESTEHEDELLVKDGNGVLRPGAILLALLAVASVAVLVGRRLSEYARRVGLLKAVGSTPRVIAAMFLAENLLLSLFAAVLGLVVGWQLSPLVTEPGAALVGAAGAPPISFSTIVEVIALAIIVSLAATLVPAIRASRGSTVAALNDTGRLPKRHGALVRISDRLPIPALFGLRLVARRPRRTLLSTANVAVTITGIVTVLAFHAFAHGKLAVASVLDAGGLSDPVINRDSEMLTIVTVMLVTLAVLNALFTTWATVLDARRSSALMRALGARSRQVSSGLVIAQVFSALPGAILGIPLGFGLFKAAIHGGTLPPLSWLFIAVLGCVLAMALLTVLPARAGARHPVAEILQSETA